MSASESFCASACCNKPVETPTVNKDSARRNPNVVNVLVIGESKFGAT